MKRHFHFIGGIVAVGMLLVEGARLRSTDMYDSTGGNWVRCPCPGLTLGVTQTVWIRPEELTFDEKVLLGHLANTSRRYYDCIAFNAGLGHEAVFVPTPNFMWPWDRRFHYPGVRHPECVQSLADIGILKKQECDGYDVVFYSMTDYGRRLAHGLLA